MKDEYNKGTENSKIVRSVLVDSLFKLAPGAQMQNPVILPVYISAIIVTILYIFGRTGGTGSFSGAAGGLALFLWLTVLSANFARGMSKSRGKIQAACLRSACHEITARRLLNPQNRDDVEVVVSSQLKKGDLYLVRAGEQIAADGEVLDGAASVDESAVTGESAPVIREAGGNRNSVTGGTMVLSDWLLVRVTQDRGDSFIDKIITMVEKVEWVKTEREKTALLTASFAAAVLSIIALFYAAGISSTGAVESAGILVSLFACLLPGAFSVLLPAAGIAGMSRLNRRNVLAGNSRILETLGKADVLLLNKTGTITLGNRQASEFIPLTGCTETELADAAQLASMADETPEGRSIMVLAKEKYGLRGRDIGSQKMTFLPYTETAGLSGVNYGDCEIRKGIACSICDYVEQAGGSYPEECGQIVDAVLREGKTPLAVTRNHQVLGVICLKDIIKDDVKERFSDLRKMGIETIMISGDNPVMAAAIAAEAGVDDFLAEVTPESKLELIRRYQQRGRIVAMSGSDDGDAPALAQADVALVLNNGTSNAKKAGNLVDLDSSPTKLLEIVRIGRQFLKTQTTLKVFLAAAALAKYLVLISVLFAGIIPWLSDFQLTGQSSAATVILSVLIYNILTILGLIPMAVKGAGYREGETKAMIGGAFAAYGLGGFIISLAAIKIISRVLWSLGII